MAATVEARRLTEAHRLAQSRLAAQTVRQVLAVWPLLDMDDLDGSFERWLQVSLAVIRGQRSTSARLAANYLDLFKKLEIGASARTPLVLADSLSVDAATTSLLVTGPVSVKSALARGMDLTRAVSAARTRVAGAATRHVLDGGRSTISGTVDADRQALGWARATSGKPCHFCAMLASRGPVYKGEGTADFKPHDACHCEPEPVYRRDAAWPAGSQRYAALWSDAKRTASSEGIDTALAFRRLIEAR